MLVGDLVYNDDFDVNCNYEIYDCTDVESWYDAEMIYGTMRDGWKKPLNEILDMKIKYITTNHQSIIIEAANSMRKIKGVIYYQIDIEALALHEVMLELKNAGMENIELKVIDSWKTENLPEDWFDDYTFKIEFSGTIDCSTEEFLINATCVDEIY